MDFLLLAAAEEVVFLGAGAGEFMGLESILKSLLGEDETDKTFLVVALGLVVLVVAVALGLAAAAAAFFGAAAAGAFYYLL